MKNLLKRNILPIARFLKYDLRNSVFWARSQHKNWGDDLNPWLFEKLTGKKAVYCPHPSCRRFIMVGSILTSGSNYDTCWGTGLISEKLCTPLKLSKALAVRGPLSAQELEKSGIEPPSIYGDPGLIASHLTNFSQNKKYKISIIPHYIDRKEGEAFAKEKGYNVINVDLPIEKFIEEIACSEQVWSSSLHGIICPESMGIPTMWIKFSDRIIGGSFKYNDYFLGTQRSISQPVEVSTVSTNLESIRFLEPFDIDKTVQDLMSVFPYQHTYKSI